jgi:hypothetical protein
VLDSSSINPSGRGSFRPLCGASTMML